MRASGVASGKRRRRRGLRFASQAESMMASWVRTEYARAEGANAGSNARQNQTRCTVVRKCNRGAGIRKKPCSSARRSTAIQRLIGDGGEFCVQIRQGLAEHGLVA